MTLIYADCRECGEDSTELPGVDTLTTQLDVERGRLELRTESREGAGLILLAMRSEGHRAWRVGRTVTAQIRPATSVERPQQECSICRRRHGSEVQHACE